MRPLARLLEEGQRLNLRAARSSQALVIEGVSRVVHAGPDRLPAVRRRVAQVQLDLTAILIGDPDRFVDSLYAYAQTLMDLHHEFVHRVLEALDSGDRTASENRGPLADVIPLLARNGMGR